MDLFAQIFGMTLMVLGTLTVVVSIGALIYYNLFWVRRKKGAPGGQPGPASDQQSGDATA